MYIIYSSSGGEWGHSIKEFASCENQEDAYLLADILEEELEKINGYDPYTSIEVKEIPSTYTINDEVKFREDAIKWLDRGF